MTTVYEKMQTMVQEAGVQAYEKLIGILPEAVLAIVIVVAGWLVATVAHFLTVRLLAFFAVDKLAGKTPLDRMLKNIGFKKSVSEIIALLIFWLAVLVTLVFASEILHLEQVSRALAVITRYIPQVIAALLIIVFGMLLAKFLQTIVTEAVARAEVGYEKSVGRAVHILVLIFVFLAASEQLGFDLSFITTNVIILLATLALICGVAFVVGARSLIENVLACRQVKHHVSVGDRICVSDTEGTVKEFTLTAVIVEDKDRVTIVPASFFFKHTYTTSHTS